MTSGDVRLVPGGRQRQVPGDLGTVLASPELAPAIIGVLPGAASR